MVRQAVEPSDDMHCSDLNKTIRLQHLVARAFSLLDEIITLRVSNLISCRALTLGNILCKLFVVGVARLARRKSHRLRGILTLQPM